uniref:Uncharacterized protein n=1 Tax=Arundo donax TaxID=35708 RepID=A0A0A9FCU4_ARUDO
MERLLQIFVGEIWELHFSPRGSEESSIQVESGPSTI